MVKIIKVEEWMSKPVISLKPENTVDDTIKLMVKKNIGVVAIVKDEKLMGIVTERDIVKRVASVDLDKSTSVSKIMTPKPETIEHDATVLDVTKVMSDNNFRRLIVKKNDKIVGIITAKDVIKLMSA
ncbi:CBS domain-containing protein [archaeon]|nr:CBS domain-containing protein [archaeon]MBT6821317.1 CBS domain-containing protein [archaeon]MBT7392869.1 CBS domain-containing protein [archaeon]